MATANSLNPLPPTFWAALTAYPVAYYFLYKTRSWYASALARDFDRKVLAQNIVSSFHSLSVGAAALRIATSPNIGPGTVASGAGALSVPWRGENFGIVDLVLGLESGYLLYDLVLEVILIIQGKGSPLILTHHTTIGGGLAAWFILMPERKAGYWVMLFLVMNVSTPLLHIRWYLRKSNRGGLAVRTAAEVALTGVFFMCRIAMVPYILTQWGHVVGMSWWRAFMTLPFRCQFPTLALSAANTLWWSKLATGTFKQVVGLTKGKDSKEQGKKKV